MKLKLRFYRVGDWYRSNGKDVIAIEQNEELSTYDPETGYVMDGMWNDEYAEKANKIELLKEIEVEL